MWSNIVFILSFLLFVAHCDNSKCDTNIRRLLCMRIKNIKPSVCRANLSYKIKGQFACLSEAPRKCTNLPNSCIEKSTTLSPTAETTQWAATTANPTV